ncbi:unnamed protein product, partial [Candidula unifasciata]
MSSKVSNFLSRVSRQVHKFWQNVTCGHFYVISIVAPRLYQNAKSDIQFTYSASS